MINIVFFCIDISTKPMFKFPPMVISTDSFPNDIPQLGELLSHIGDGRISGFVMSPDIICSWAMVGVLL